MKREVELLQLRLNKLEAPTSAEVALVKAARLEEDALLVRWRVPRADVVLKRRLGEGGFGEVFAGVLRGVLPVAVKMMSRGKMTADSLERFQLEIRHMARLRHPAIVGFVACAWDAPDVLLCLELCSRGPLDALLQNSSVALTWSSPCHGYALSVASALAYLHNAFSPPLLHRDVKTENVLVTETGACRLSDMGEARGLATATMSQVGTFTYMAPELIEGREYSEKVDVFAFGIFLYEVATRRAPHSTNLVDLDGRRSRRMPLLRAIVRGHRPQFLLDGADAGVVRPALAALACRCWAHEPSSRPSMHDVLLELADLV